MFFPNSSDLLSGRQVLVIGFARQGQALARWLPTVGARVIVTDMRPQDDIDVDLRHFPQVRFALGGHPLELLDDTRLVCVSGGVPLNLPIVEEAIRRQIPVTNDAQLFLERCPAPVIGITGSAGKTTTTTLVGQMLKNAGQTTWIGGNIGNVLLDVIMGIRPEHQVVMELSSFQLELVFTSPLIGAVLNITPNHLDRHGTMENYMRAKANIIAHQPPGSAAILGRDDPGSRSLEPIVQGDLVWFSMREIVPHGAFMVGSRLTVAGIATPDDSPHIVCDVSEIPLRGEHNVLNVLAACAIAGTAGVPPDIMRDTILTFQSVPHRLETIRELNGVTYVNDSIATAPERVIAALNSYTEPIILLAGGADKKLSWTQMIALALHKTRHIIAFGRDGDIVLQTVQQLTGHTDQVTRVETLEQAVLLAAKLAQSGDVVLLSPGGTSYDAYQDFAARGEHFRQLVMAL
ncbi:MAG: UDP-N-acetylmuramoyl-L-alanine--D-glutamate ligase [Phototrophicales bacterium]|nr:MAG: UDP-N-acetylmuramoyl-L-alanine--D-glutamate ligase [Phototrophicales bacterium]RMG70292.1 MAG: UDP-N-acetylmuramoyl-L-alanine--D-glutamate ligase [Chloroflexota bacterium]